MALPAVLQVNLVLAWVWIALGFLSGAVLGFDFKFFREEWLGGYSGLRRRLYRLGHISFFGLALVNLMFYFTVRALPEPGFLAQVAAWGFAVGAVSMPACCFTMAHFPRLRHLFYVPVASLVGGSLFTLAEILRP